MVASAFAPPQMPDQPTDFDQLRLSRHPRRRGKPAVVAACLGLGGGLLAVGYLSLREPVGQVQELPGGARVELRGWTFGPNHTFIDGDYAHRLLLQGGEGLEVLGGYRATHQDMGNDLVLWFRSDEYAFPGRSLSAAWIDPHGCRISTGAGWADLLPHSALYASRKVFWKQGDLERPESRFIEAPRITPRRGQNPLRYVVVDRSRAEPLASFMVPGVPRVSADTAGAPSPLPIRTTVGDTTFVLKSLRHEEPGRYPLSRSALSFDCEEKGLHSRDWRVARVFVEDGTGNELASLVPPATPGAPVLFETLCRRDPAWKLSVRFARRDPLRVPPDAVWTLRDVRVPRLGEGVELTDNLFASGMRVQLESFHGGPKTVGRTGSTVWNAGMLQWNVAAPEGGQLRLLRLTDQEGRVLFPGRTTPNHPFTSVWDLSANESLGDTPIFRPVVYPSGTRRLNLTFGFYHTRTAEFIVRP